MQASPLARDKLEAPLSDECVCGVSRLYLTPHVFGILDEKVTTNLHVCPTLQYKLSLRATATYQLCSLNL